MNTVSFTDDDVGKTVVDSGGEEIGTVSAVEDGTAYVDPDPGVTDQLKAKLGWEDRDDESYPLPESAVETVTDDLVQLGSNL
jgi:hypothetical protein